jgi:hypothetical protein
MGFSGRAILVLAAMISFASAGPGSRGQTDGTELATILKKAAAYCHRLEGAALDFVCQEEAKEFSAHFTPSIDVYLYDYQFVRKNQETKEQRKLLSLNGEKASTPDMRLRTATFQYENVLFGPIGLLSESWQAYHEYTLVGRETAGRTTVAIIEARPAVVPFEAHCFGRVWVREDDGSVVKIVWDPKSVGNYQLVEEWAKQHGAEPLVSAFSEYGFEKNGLRFPSRSYSEEAYRLADKSKAVNAWISVTYKKYKFFTVETEVKY